MRTTGPWNHWERQMRWIFDRVTLAFCSATLLVCLALAFGVPAILWLPVVTFIAGGLSVFLLGVLR